MSGFYLMYRGWMDNPVFSGEAFSRRDAWAWLIEEAAFKPQAVGVSGKKLVLQRGQLCHSLRFMARAWGWDEAKVRRFLSRLQREEMIRSVADAGQTVITICNYSNYQISECVDDAPTDAAVTQHRRSSDANKNEGNEGKEVMDDGGDAHDCARIVAEHFLAERDRLWPSNPNFPAPKITLETQAAQFLTDGGPVDLINATVTATMEKLVKRGDPNPPTNLGFCARSVASRIAAARNIGDTDSGYQSSREPRQRSSYDDEIRANRAATLRALAGELGAMRSTSTDADS